MPGNNRRGHMSRKVANVKLRPRAAGGPSSSTSRQRESTPDEEVWREEFAGGEDDDEEPEVGSTARPWVGVCVTFTGVEDKLVKALGGTVENALTVSVTHVVAQGFGSLKYNYAVEHRIPVMAPSWILFAHDNWIRDEDVNFRSAEEFHRLPAFSGLTISISGIVDSEFTRPDSRADELVERRKQIIQVINSNGGIYSKDLDRNCTHLVSAQITTQKPSEKIKWALRENATRDVARRRGRKTDTNDIQIVYEEWIWDCVAFCGRFKEETYDARNPRPKGRVTPVLDGSIFEEEERGKPVPVAEKEEEEPAVVRKRKKAAMDGLVGDIISTKAASRSAAEAAPGEVVPSEADQGSEPQVQLGRRETEKKPSLLHLNRSGAFDARATSNSKTTSSFPLTIDRNDTSMTIPLDSKDLKEREAEPIAESSFFANLRFSHVIEEKCDGLEAALVAHGGKFVTNENRLKNGEEVDYVIVRLNKQKPVELVDGIKAPEVVTECWVEACCFEQRMISPDSHIVFRPLTAAMPIPGAQDLNVHLSGFSTAETVYLRRLLKAIGGGLSEKMNRSTTHLISATDDTPKARKAPEWDVKLVRDSWLLKTAETGALQPESEHVFQSDKPASSGPSVSDQRILNAQSTSVNLSTVLELGDPTFQHGKVPSLPTPNETAGARSLKAIPTHVDRGTSLAGIGFASASVVPADRDSAGPSHVLSPPKAETERILNSASGDSADSRADSSSSKVSRSKTAPERLVGGAVALKGDNDMEKDGRASEPAIRPQRPSAALPDGLLAKKDMTDALRHLAGPGDISSARKPRRKPGSKLGPGHMRAGSGSGSGRITPSASSSWFERTPSPEVNRFEPPPPIEPAEETFRVNYVDSAAEKEKKRLLDGARRAERSRALEQSSSKRVKH